MPVLVLQSAPSGAREEARAVGGLHGGQGGRGRRLARPSALERVSQARPSLILLDLIVASFMMVAAAAVAVAWCRGLVLRGRAVQPPEPGEVDEEPPC